MDESSQKKKVGRPSKYNKINLDTVALLAQRGFTDAEIAKVIGIHRDTFIEWKKQHQKFSDLLKPNKERADAEVERSLYERACGYETKETKVVFQRGKWKTLDIIKHYPPDPTSMIFWLKNRQPEKWRDRQAVDVNLGIEDKLREIWKKHHAN